MAALKGGSHDADIANALKGIVHPAHTIFICHLNNDFLRKYSGDLRMRNELLAQLFAQSRLCMMILYSVWYPWPSHGFLARGPGTAAAVTCVAAMGQHQGSSGTGQQQVGPYLNGLVVFLGVDEVSCAPLLRPRKLALICVDTNDHFGACLLQRIHDRQPNRAQPKDSSCAALLYLHTVPMPLPDPGCSHEC